MTTTSAPSQGYNITNKTRQHAGIIQFPIHNKQKLGNHGWICNISSRYVFCKQHHEYLQIKPSAIHTQFDLIVNLLDAGTCRVIYFDEQLTPAQLAEIRLRHRFSKTELVHAKVAFLFTHKVSNLHA